MTTNIRSMLTLLKELILIDERNSQRFNLNILSQPQKNIILNTIKVITCYRYFTNYFSTNVTLF